jgi:microsomal epoxide hydrolase
VSPDIKPFEVRISDPEIDDLKSRLSRTRWPDQIDGTDWEYGTNLDFLVDFCRYWQDDFDWEGFHARTNAFPQFVAHIDDQQIHFIHARSAEPGARPLLLSHGWPGSVAEFWNVLGPLSDPVRFGGDRADAFHVVAPSLPGYGFSGPTTSRGWDIRRIARAFAALMSALGYDRFFAQGGDWGALISRELPSDRVAAIHLNILRPDRPEGDATAGLSEEVLARIARSENFMAEESAYSQIQATKPQTLAYGLNDSPAGLAGWILEKFRTWSDCGGDVYRSFERHHLADNVSIYWFTGTINSSTRLYYESIGPGRAYTRSPITVPLGYAAFPAEIVSFPRAWYEKAFPTLCHWTEMPKGGHFAAMEQPELFVDDLRAFFRSQQL